MIVADNDRLIGAVFIGDISNTGLDRSAIRDHENLDQLQVFKGWISSVFESPFVSQEILHQTLNSGETIDIPNRIENYQAQNITNPWQSFLTKHKPQDLDIWRFSVSHFHGCSNLPQTSSI